MKKIIIFLSLFMFFINVYAESKQVLFSKCVDGDTAYFTIDEEMVKVRFLAIDTPESVSTKVKEEPFGKEASDFTCEKLTNAKSIVLEYEKNKKDKYGRTLAWIWVDENLLQKEIIENGYGKVAYIYGKYKYTNSLCNIQNNVMNEKVNVWSNPSYEVGYCSNITITNEDNISYSDLEDIALSSKASSTIKKVNTISDKIENIINSKSFENILFYVILICAVVTTIFKYFKKVK